MNPQGVCRFLVACAGLAALLVTGTLCLMHGDDLPHAVLKAGAAMVGMVIVLRHLVTLLVGVWTGGQQRRPAGSARESSEG